jgi:hypothetical protein
VFSPAGRHPHTRRVSFPPKFAAGTPAALRLFLCQRNERELLRPWLRHALSLVDAPRDVMVVDDNSTDADVVAALQEAEAAGVRVQWVRPPQLPAFRRKHLMFTQWVQSHRADEAAFYVPLDCDEFLAARRRLPGPVERVALRSAVLLVNTEVSGDRERVRQVLRGALLPSGRGTWTVKRMRNFSHLPGLFADTREHLFCGCSTKIVVCGGGTSTLKHPTAVPNRGYHTTTTGAQLGLTHVLCLVEFHNLPFAMRQHKSLVMLRVVPQEGRTKYRTEGTCSRREYEEHQEKAAHLQACARSEAFAALMAHVRFDGGPAPHQTQTTASTARPAELRSASQNREETFDPRPEANAHAEPPSPAAAAIPPPRLIRIARPIQMDTPRGSTSPASEQPLPPPPPPPHRRATRRWARRRWARRR